MKYFSALLLSLGLALSGLACDAEDEQICEDLNLVLSAKASQLPKNCEDDSQCVLVPIHAGFTVAANKFPNDSELVQVRQRQSELCAPYEEDRTIYSAVCVEELCEALPIGQLPDDPDMGSDPDVGPGPDVGPESACEMACGNADRCNALEEIGLGTSLENCVLRCDVLVENDPDNEDTATFLRCLANRTCEDLPACL